MNTNDNKIEINLISQNIFQTLFNEERPDLFVSQISYQSSSCCCFLFVLVYPSINAVERERLIFIGLAMTNQILP